MKVWLVVELHGAEPPRIIGAFRSKKKAEEIAYDPRELNWRNIIPLRVIGG